MLFHYLLTCSMFCVLKLFGNRGDIWGHKLWPNVYFPKEFLGAKLSSANPNRIGSDQFDAIQKCVYIDCQAFSLLLFRFWAIRKISERTQFSKRENMFNPTRQPTTNFRLYSYLQFGAKLVCRYDQRYSTLTQVVDRIRQEFFTWEKLIFHVFCRCRSRSNHHQCLQTFWQARNWQTRGAAVST